MNTNIKQEETTLAGVPTTHLQSEIFGYCCHVFIDKLRVDVALPESGRAFGHEDAVAQLKALIALAQQAIEVIQGGKDLQCCIHCLEEREKPTNWRLEVIEDALREDESR